MTDEHFERFKFNINPFQINFSFLYLLKTSESLMFSDVFKGYRKWLMAWNELTPKS